MNTVVLPTKVLPGTHISPETAYVVEDYPYGFRLRCKIRYWLDCHPKKGARLVSQTTNPKKPGEVWNKPKASTFCRFGGAMFIDDAGHVHWSGMHEYMDGPECRDWFNAFGDGVPELLKPLSQKWLKAKEIYTSLMAQRAAKEAV